MESRADIYGVGILEKGKHFIRQASGSLQRAAAVLFGILLSNVVLPGGISPFGVAYALAAPMGVRRCMGVFMRAGSGAWGRERRN